MTRELIQCPCTPKYNSILPSPVYGFSTQEVEGNGEFKRKKVESVFCFKERETLEINLQFWGCYRRTSKMPNNEEIKRKISISF